jgi:sugar phosphate isomerase/epimerase
MMTRRRWLESNLGALAALAFGEAALAAEESRPAMGVVIHSYGLHQAADKDFGDPLRFLDFCRARGAGGVQLGLRVRDADYTARVRKFLDTHHLYLEASLALPRDRGDVERFTAEVKTAKDCGVAVARTVLTTGRRYEVFDSAEGFRAFARQARQSLELARPIAEKHTLKLAVENHKDLRAVELVELIQEKKSDHVGVCVDTGNNIALLEKAQETVDLLAPFAFTSHIKDMAVEEYTDGFLLSEVPLGTGILDMPAICRALRKAQPGIRFNLEMITRDPLKIPCLTRKYWATLEQVPAPRLADMLALVRARAAKLPRISTLSADEKLQREDDNVKASLRFAARGIRD